MPKKRWKSFFQWRPPERDFRFLIYTQKKTYILKENVLGGLYSALLLPKFPNAILVWVLLCMINEYQKLENNIWINITLWAFEYGSSNFRWGSLERLLSALQAHGHGAYACSQKNLSLLILKLKVSINVDYAWHMDLKGYILWMNLVCHKGIKFCDHWILSWCRWNSINKFLIENFKSVKFNDKHYNEYVKL